MRVPLNWLSEWVDLPGESELMDRLTFAGLEIESLERSGPDLGAIRVGHVLERAPHPNADRLSLCTVDVGDGEPVEIVCGAPNVDSGQKVAVASPGTTLPDGTKLKKSKIRGVVSLGMICSESELGLGEGHEGILVLDTDAVPGTPLPEVLPGNPVLDLEITPNRGDWASMLGVAREVRAHYGGELRMPETAVREDGGAATGAVAIVIDDGPGCYRYLGRVVRGVQVGPSPEWLVAKLEAAGLRSINVVVDVTNLVLLEFGQPLHAFDLATLRGGEIRVRRARADEKIATLDGQMRKLDPEDLVIADAERPVAVAGVMGGAETEVRDDTSDVLLECAHFSPLRVRRTARRLGIHSDASYRFERGVDAAGLQRAIDRAAHLLCELAGGTLEVGTVEALGDAFEHVDSVELDPEHPNRLLGTSLTKEEVVACLARVDIEAVTSGARLVCSVPSYRNDIAIAEDLIEEVARVYGYDRIGETLPDAEIRAHDEPPRHALEHEVRASLRAAGLIEVRTFPGTPANDADLLGLAGDDARRDTLRILNPHVEDAGALRTTLVPSLLRVARLNLAHQLDRIAVFEVGRHFRRAGANELPNEVPCAAGVLTQPERPPLWEGEIEIFFRAKGAVERLLRDLGLAGEFRDQEAERFLHPGASASIYLGNTRMGFVGELHPEVASAFDIDPPCALFELDLGQLVTAPRHEARYRAISHQPLVRRDVAVLVAEDVAAGELLAAIRQTAGKHLISVDLFDRYQGKGIPAGKVSLAFRLVLQRADRTLTEAEITKMTDRVRQMLVHRFSGELR